MLKKAIPMIIVIALIINLGATLSIYAAEINVNSTQLSSSEPIVDNEINIPDINLKAALNKSIDSNREDNQIIRQSELENLTSLDLDNKEITNLDGLEYCKNVVEINLSNNKVSDLSPLKNLINLTKLSLDNNCINDISALKNLNNLNSLSLNNQSINANEIKITKNLAEVNNIVKIIDGSPVPIVSTDDYIYNSNSNTITFINILENCNKSYSFSTNVSLGKSTALFSGIVTHKITYTKDTSYNNDIAYNIEDWEYKKNDEAKTIELTKYKEMANKDVKIPDKFNGLEEYTVILNGGIETFPYDITSIETVDTDNNSLTKIKLLSGNSLFKDKTVLTKVNLDWDTSQVTDMKQMFKNLSSNLKELNLNNWDVSNVTNMEEMFYDLSQIEELDLSTWTKVKSDVKLNDFITSPINPLYIKTADIDLKNKITQLINSKAIKTYDINLELGEHVTATKNVISKGLIETDEDKKINKNDLEKSLNIDEGFVIDGWYTNAELADEWDFNTEVTRDITLYPKVSNNNKTLRAEDVYVPTEGKLYPNSIDLYGQQINHQNGTLTNFKCSINFNTSTHQLEVTGNDNYLHMVFRGEVYFSVKILNSNGEIKLNKEFYGENKTGVVKEALNGVSFDYGDIIQFYHKEPNKLIFKGDIIAEEGLTEGLTHDEKNECIFEITPSGLKKRETPTPEIKANNDLYIFKGSTITEGNMWEGIVYKDRIQKEFEAENKNTNIACENIKTDEIGPNLVEYTVTNNFGKSASITRTVNIIATTYPNTIEIKGQKISGITDERRAIIKFNNNNINGDIGIEVNIADASSSGYNLHDSFISQTYFSIKILSADGEVKLNEKFDGGKSGRDIQKALADKQVAYGDIIQMYHKEPSRLGLTGGILNSNPTDNEKNTCIFKITPYGLEKCETPTPEIEANDDLYIFQGSTITEENMWEGIVCTDRIQKYFGVENKKTSIEAENINTSDIGTTSVTYTVTNNFGKSASITRTVNIIATTYPNTIEIHGIGYAHSGTLKDRITFDPVTKKLKVTPYTLSDTSLILHSSFLNETYFSIKILNSKGETKLDTSFLGGQTIQNVADALNDFPFDYGYIIQFYHREPNKLIFKGDILNGTPTDAEKNTCFFEITPFGLRKDSVVDIPDPNLKKALNKAINNNRLDTQTITKTELESLTEELDLSNKNISNLTGMQNCTNITKLSVNNNDISDITPLKDLTRLTKLYFGGNNVTDISSLSKLVNIDNLDISRNPNLSNIKVLENFPQLRTLLANNDSISDISPLANLAALTEVHLEGQSITVEEVQSVGSKATVGNMIKNLNGESVGIQNGNDYTYNEGNNTITFTGIVGNCTKEYSFRTTVLVGAVRAEFYGTVIQPVEYKEVIECISIPKTVTMQKVDNSEYVEGEVNVSIVGNVAYSSIDVQINPSLELIYNRNKVKVDILENGSIINLDGEVGTLTKEHNKISLKLRAKKADFKYMNKVEYSGVLEFTFSN